MDKLQARPEYVVAARQELSAAFDPTTGLLPPGTNMGPVFDQMAEALSFALERYYGRGFEAGHKARTASDSPVRNFKQGPVNIRVYETDFGTFVAADGAGWLPGSWTTADEALQGALDANGLSPQHSLDPE